MRKQAYMFLNAPRGTVQWKCPEALFRLAMFARSGGGDVGRNDIAKKRIMLVDDERDVSMILKSGLERNGFSVEVFNDPLEALAQFKTEYYDLLLLDVRMPRMSGFELYKEIKKLDKSAKVRMISAFEIQESIEYLTEKEARSVIQKPISAKELAAIINKEISGNS